MSNIKDFKSAADDIMSGVNVDEALKAKTLRRCRREHFPIYILVPAAACAVIAAAVILTAVLQPGGESNIPNVMMSSESPGVAVSVMAATMDDARAALGGAFLEPGVTPEGFSMQGIEVISEGRYVFVTLQYMGKGRSYLIIEEKTQMSLKFEGYRTDINGMEGYVVSRTEGAAEAEVHWIINNIHYAVMGDLSESEALEIARSMK